MALPNQVPDSEPKGLNERHSFNRRFAATWNGPRPTGFSGDSGETPPRSSSLQPEGPSHEHDDLNDDGSPNVQPGPDPPDEGPTVVQPEQPPTTNPENLPAQQFRDRMQKWQFNLKLWWNNFQEFCREWEPDEDHWITRAMSVSKLPGLKQAVKKGAHFMARAAFVCEFIFLLTLSTVLISLGISFLLTHPVDNSSEPMEVGLQAIPFPGFVVTSTRNSFEEQKQIALNLYEKFKYDEIVEYKGEEWNKLDTGKLLFVLDHLLKTYRGHSTFLYDRSMKPKFQMDYQKWIKRLKITVKMSDDSFQKILRFMISHSQSCKDMITDCTVKGWPIDCTLIFRLVFTDMGFGCAANSILDNILMKEKDVRWLTSEMANTDISDAEKAAWPAWEYKRDQIFDENGQIKTPDNQKTSYPWKIPENPEEERKTSVPVPLYQDVAGSRKGIKFRLHAPIVDSNGPFSTHDGIGHIISFHHPLDMATLEEDGVGIELDKQYFLELGPDIRLTDDGIKNVVPKKKQCYFPCEVSLDYFTKYTEKNCQKECLAKLTMKICKCASISLPHPANMSLCSEDEMRCVEHVLETAYITDAVSECLPCYPLCNVVKYGVRISSIALPRDTTGEDEGNTFNNTAAGKKMSHNLIAIFMGKNSYSAKVKISKINPTEIGGILGGILSGTFGFSLHSVSYILQALYIVLAELAAFIFMIFYEKLFSAEFWKKFFKRIRSGISSFFGLIWDLICEILGFFWDGLNGIKDYVGACCFYMFNGQLKEEQPNRPNRNVRVNQPRGDVEQPGGRPLPMGIWHPLDIGRRARVIPNHDDYSYL